MTECIGLGSVARALGERDLFTFFLCAATAGEPLTRSLLDLRARPHFFRDRGHIFTEIANIFFRDCQHIFSRSTRIFVVYKIQILFHGNFGIFFPNRIT